jgi:preprotein translocase subunit YajC
VSETGFLANLKEGDEVILCWGTVDTIVKITRVTAAHICINDLKINRKTNTEVGASKWNRRWLREATAEATADIRGAERRRALVATLRNMRWDNLSDEALEAVSATLIAQERRAKLVADAKKDFP